MSELSKARINGVEYELKDTTARQSSGGTVDLSGYLKKTELTDAINTALAQAKESGEFDGEPGYTPQKGVDYFDGEPGYTPQKNVDYFDGDDYILTDTDKNEIAEQAAMLVEIPVEKCTPQMFGAVGDGVTDDASAFDSWLNHIAENNIDGYIPNGTYLVKRGVGYKPSAPSGKRISFVGESADKTIIKAGFSAGNVFDFRKCYLGEFGNLTIDNNESSANEYGVTGFQMLDMQYTENVFSYIHDINIINVGRRAAIIYNTANDGTPSIAYVNMVRVNAVGFTADRTAWGSDSNPTPVGIIVADTAHFHFINCTSKNFKHYPLEFKNYTECCSNENCVIENCGYGLYLGQEGVPADAICHTHYKAIGNVIKDTSIGVMAAKLAHCTFDNNTIIPPDGDSAATGFAFNPPCEYVTGAGNNYYGDRYAVQFRNGTGESVCHDNVIEIAIHKSVFTTPYMFADDCQRCSVIATNYQTIAKNKNVDSNNNSFIPIVNVLTDMT